jgi:para-nitrobenzyl esterase
MVFRWPSLQLAAAHGANGEKAYVYLFDWESPAFDGLLGSCHALELPFVFGAVHVPVVQMFSGGGPPAETLSRQMQMAWLSFAASGDPSHEGIGAWRPWERDERATMMFGAASGLVSAPRDRELAVLERYRPLQGSR